MHRQLVSKNPETVATDRNIFFRAITNHSCPKCEHDETVFVAALKRHRCARCGWVINNRNQYYGSPLQPLPWSSMSREQLPVLFGRLFFKQAHIVTRGFNYLMASTAHHKALRATFDTGGLLHMAYTSDDIRLKRAAVNRYFDAIRELRRSILLPNADRTMVMFCVMYLQICATFDCIAETGDGWLVHGKALHRLMRAHGSASLTLEQQTCFSGHMRLFALWNAIMRRERVDISEKFWVRSFAGCEFTNFIRFNSVLIQVPGALETCDEVCRNRTNVSPAAVADCMAELSALEGELHECVNEGYATANNFSPYWTIGNLAVSNERKESQAQPPQFPTLYDFPSVSTALVHVNHWMSVLALRQAQLDIRKNVPRSRFPSDLPMYDSLDMMTVRTAECADSLCMCIPYLVQSRHGYLGMMSAIGPLQMSANWYRRQNKSSKLTWCEDTIKYLHSRGIRTPQAGGEDNSTSTSGSKSQVKRCPKGEDANALTANDPIK